MLEVIKEMFNDWWTKRKELNKVRIDKEHELKLKFIAESAQIKHEKKIHALRQPQNMSLLGGFTKALDALVPPNNTSNKTEEPMKENKLNKTLGL